MSFKLSFIFLTSLFLLSACGSSKIKDRREQRDRMMANSKVYCDFVNGEQYPDMDITLNLEMAKKCDTDRPFSLTQYTSRNETTGILYCCATGRGSSSMERMSMNGNPSGGRRAEKAEIRKETPNSTSSTAAPNSTAPATNESSETP